MQIYILFTVTSLHILFPFTRVKRHSFLQIKFWRQWNKINILKSSVFWDMVPLKPTDVSKEHVASILTAENKTIQYIFPKRRLNAIGLHDIISQKTTLYKRRYDSFKSCIINISSLGFIGVKIQYECNVMVLTLWRDENGADNLPPQYQHGPSHHGSAFLQKNHLLVRGIQPWKCYYKNTTMHAKILVNITANIATVFFRLQWMRKRWNIFHHKHITSYIHIYVWTTL
jgi:hypothetical protein